MDPFSPLEKKREKRKRDNKIHYFQMPSMASVSRNGVKAKVLGRNVISPTLGGRSDVIHMDEINILPTTSGHEEDDEVFNAEAGMGGVDHVYQRHGSVHCPTHLVADMGVQTNESKLPALRRSKSSKRSQRRSDYRYVTGFPFPIEGI